MELKFYQLTNRDEDRMLLKRFTKLRLVGVIENAYRFREYGHRLAELIDKFTGYYECEPVSMFIEGDKLSIGPDRRDLHLLSYLRYGKASDCEISRHFCITEELVQPAGSAAASQVPRELGILLEP